MLVNFNVIESTRKQPFPDLQIGTGEVILSNKHRMSNGHTSQKPGEILIAKLKRVSSGPLAGGIQACTKPVMGQLVHICPSSSSQVTKSLKRTPTNVHVSSDKNGAVKGFSHFQHPSQNLTVERILVATNHSIGEKVHRENVQGQLRNLNDSVQQPLGAPRLRRDELRPRREGREGTCNTDTSTQAAKGTKGVGNSKFVWDRV